MILVSVYRSLLLFQHGGFRPAGGGFRELARGEAPDDVLLALDPVGALGSPAVEVRADSGHGRAFDRYSFD